MARRQAIICSNAWILLDLKLRNKLQWNLKRNSSIFIQENTFENVVCERETILSRSQCVKMCQINTFIDLLILLSNTPWLRHIFNTNAIRYMSTVCNVEWFTIFRERYIHASHTQLTFRRHTDVHYDDVIMGTIASQITSLTIVYSTVYSGADQS